MVPLFSMPSTTSWGVGEFPDLVPFSRWMRAAGLDVLQLLPLNEMASGQHSPYSALSAMALDPVFIALGDVPEFAALGGEAALPAEERARLAHVRATSRVDFVNVQQVKRVALRAAFDRFLDHDCRHESPRARAFAAFVARERWWLDAYALFRAIHAAQRELPWWQWPESLRTPADALASTSTVDREVRYGQYVQWIADEQWRRARAATAGLGLLGDLPFMVGGDSADVWSRQHEFMLDATIGAPPDAFSATGQDWGVPAYRWDVIARGNFEWFRQRARRAADLFDGYRLDHLVGLFRTYVRPRAGEPYFVPGHEPEQRWLGETMLDLFKEAGALVIAEDLGTVPDFVRASLAARQVPGFKVLRWERDWHAASQPYVDPSDYSPSSVAMTGTHDTEPMATWWMEAPADEVAALSRLPPLRERAFATSVRGYGPLLRDAVLRTLLASGSRLVVVPVQDIFGWTDRINMPATVGDDNWTFRLPWSVDRWLDEPEARERAEWLSQQQWGQVLP